MASRRIEDLDQRFQPMVFELLRRGSMAVAPFTFFITDGYRSLEEQAQLYAQGRTKPGNIVTQAKPGQSAHNYGLAVDLAFQKDNVVRYDDSLYQKVYPIARELGFVLGADWTSFRDRPHFEYPNWQHAAQQKVPPMPTTQPQVYPSTRNVSVVPELGVNLRLEPTTKSKVAATLTKGTSVRVTGFVTGEMVAGVDTWWLVADGTYMWSGATNYIPKVSVTTPNVSTPLVGETGDIDKLRHELGDMEESYLEALGIMQTQEVMIAELQEQVASLSTVSDNTAGLVAANEALSSEVVAKKDRIKQLSHDLSIAYAKAFTNWQLIEVGPGVRFIWQLFPLLITITKNLWGMKNEGYVIGWKVGAKLYRTQPEPTGLEKVTSEHIEAVINK